MIRNGFFVVCISGNIFIIFYILFTVFYYCQLPLHISDNTNFEALGCVQVLWVITVIADLGLPEARPGLRSGAPLHGTANKS